MKKLLLLGILAIIIVAGCTTEAETPTKATETGTETTETPTELKLEIGEAAKTSKIQIMVSEVKKADYYSYYSDIWEETRIKKASQGKIFIIVKAEIKNINTSREYAGSNKFSVMDSENFRYKPEYYYEANELKSYKELYPNERIEGKVLFEIPEDAKGLKLLYDFGGLFTDIKLAEWNIPEITIEKLASGRSATIEIKNVDYSWYDYRSSGTITGIDYTVSNTGSVPIEPKFDISITYGTIDIYSTEGDYGGYYKTLEADGSISETIILYQSVDYVGEYLVKVNLRDGDDLTVLDTADKTVFIGWR